MLNKLKEENQICGFVIPQHEAADFGSCSIKSLRDAANKGRGKKRKDINSQFFM